MEIQESIKRLRENENITLDQEAETIINSFTSEEKAEILALYRNDMKYLKRVIMLKLFAYLQQQEKKKNEYFNKKRV